METYKKEKHPGRNIVKPKKVEIVTRASNKQIYESRLEEMAGQIEDMLQWKETLEAKMEIVIDTVADISKTIDGLFDEDNKEV